jgi:hypothetical protein
MELTVMNLDDLVPFAGNPRHNNESAKMVAESIKTYGYICPITATGEDNIILTGHTRLKALRLLGQTSAPVLHIWGLNKDEIRGFVIADNRVGEYSRWNYSAIDRMVTEVGNGDPMLKKMGMSSFKDNKAELEAMIAGAEGSPLDAEGNYVGAEEN